MHLALRPKSHPSPALLFQCRFFNSSAVGDLLRLLERLYNVPALDMYIYSSIHSPDLREKTLWADRNSICSGGRWNVWWPWMRIDCSGGTAWLAPSHCGLIIYIHRGHDTPRSWGGRGSIEMLDSTWRAGGIRERGGSVGNGRRRTVRGRAWPLHENETVESESSSSTVPPTYSIRTTMKNRHGWLYSDSPRFPSLVF